jgi:hypothetical protein
LNLSAEFAEVGTVAFVFMRSGFCGTFCGFAELWKLVVPKLIRSKVDEAGTVIRLLLSSVVTSDKFFYHFFTQCDHSLQVV